MNYTDISILHTYINTQTDAYMICTHIYTHSLHTHIYISFVHIWNWRALSHASHRPFGARSPLPFGRCRAARPPHPLGSAFHSCETASESKRESVGYASVSIQHLHVYTNMHVLWFPEKQNLVECLALGCWRDDFCVMCNLSRLLMDLYLYMHISYMHI